ncbi:hypothetical protein BD779DRAFT_1674952 [Infundibulicybe gibba]|nr:hypothetical protein BD779DRAFT_1674952 [Infundibulicybe gibba]
MKFLGFAVTLSLLLLSSIASASPVASGPTLDIAGTRSAIRKAFEARRGDISNEYGGPTRAPAMKTAFTNITVDHFSSAVPRGVSFNFIVVHGKHQFVPMGGPMERYDESFLVYGETYTYTVIVFHTGKLIMQDDGGTQNSAARDQLLSIFTNITSPSSHYHPTAAGGELLALEPTPPPQAPALERDLTAEYPILYTQSI